MQLYMEISSRLCACFVSTSTWYLP